ncbi:MAG: hypothetical protein JKX73_11915, partial [Flavobacteriales bacterium]|nr:hypothetical protein [Flavobacteriales bacterium]
GSLVSTAVTVNPAATTSAGTDATICEGSSYALSGVRGGSATLSTWTTSGDGTFDDPSLPAAAYTNGPSDSTVGSVTLTITTNDPDGAGPCFAASDAMTITFNYRPIADAGADAAICTGSTIVIGGSPTASGGTSPYTYSWTPGGSLDNTTIANPTSNTTVTTSYQLVLEDQNSCADTDTIVVIIPLTPDTWTAKATYGGLGSSYMVGFSIGSKGYAGTGLDGTNKKDFWEFNPATNTWTQKADFGGTARQTAVGFSIGDKGYIGTGTDGSATNDFWEYDTTSNAWTQKANVGGSVRRHATGFSINGKGYIGIGYNGGANFKDFWEYNPTTDTWTQKQDFGGTARRNAMGFSINDKGYIGTGFDGAGKKDFWEYDPSTNVWTAKTDVGGATRTWAVGFSIGNKGYVGTGTYPSATYKKDFWEYDPSDNTWTQKTDLVGAARLGAFGLSINNKGYIGGGYDGSSFLQDFWEYSPDYSSSISETNVTCKGANDGVADLLVIDGVPPFTFLWSNSATTEDITGLAPGAYSVTITDANGCIINDGTTITEPATALVVDAGVDITICSSTSTTIGGSPTASGGTASYTYAWDQTATLDDSTLANPTASPAVTTTYTVNLTDSNNCSVSDAIIVTVETPLAGTYTIGGATPDYATFTLAVNDLLCKGISAPVLFDVRDGTYNESVNITYVIGTSAADTIVFEGNVTDSSLVLLTNTSGYTVQLDGADYITFKNMHLQMTLGTARVIELINGADNNNFLFNKIEAATVSTNDLTYAGIYSGPTLDNDNSIIGNLIENGNYGISLEGMSISTQETGNLIQDNIVNGGYSGAIYVKTNANVKIRSNTISSASGIFIGISLNSCIGTVSNRGLVANNMIHVGGTSNCSGIAPDESEYHDFYHNSVNITSTSTTTGRAFYSSKAGTYNLRLKNNIFSNTGGGYAVYVTNAANISESDNNDFYATGVNLARWSGDHANLGALQAASGMDATSASVDPLFVSSTDLHLTVSSPLSIQNGTDLTATVPKDIDGDFRPPQPWMGCDETIGVNRYWVTLAGGDWNDPNNWSGTSGGTGGSSVPNVTQDIYFDSNSFTVQATVTMNGSTWYCNTFQTMDINKTPIITGTGVLLVTSP